MLERGVLAREILEAADDCKTPAPRILGPDLRIGQASSMLSSGAPTGPICQK
jgi:hypothetical protein